jgi:hypothetical protein
MTRVNSHLQIGTPPDLDFSYLDGDEYSTVTTRIYFHGFDKLSTEQGFRVESPTFYAFNPKWKVVAYPEAELDQSNELDRSYELESNQLDRSDEKVILCIEHCSESSIDIGISVSIQGMFDWYEHDYARSKSNHFTSVGDRCEFNFYRYDRDCLSRGTLTVLLEMNLDTSKYSTDIMPQSNLMAKDVMTLFHDEELSDVAFDVRGEIFVAHKVIVKARAKELFDLCDGFDKEKPLPIADVHPTVFCKMLRTLYGGNITPDEWNKYAKDILKAAFKWGFDNLKAEAEARYITKLNFTSENAVEELNYADAHGCLLLKKAAATFIAESL